MREMATVRRYVTASVFGMCDMDGVFSGCRGHVMKAVNPPVRACRSRTRCRCSMRSASVSPMPYIIVTEVFMPSLCASSMISSQRSAPAFLGATMSRTRCTRISPPPPGIESSPAALRSRMTSRASMRKRVAKKSTSLGENP